MQVIMQVIAPDVPLRGVVRQEGSPIPKRTSHLGLMTRHLHRFQVGNPTAHFCPHAGIISRIVSTSPVKGHDDNSSVPYLGTLPP